VFLKQFYLESLGHASYLVGDEGTGQALVLDPRRDVDIYFEAARSQGMRVSYAVDTHGHNDYLSGICEVAARQKVDVLGSAVADLSYDHRPVKDGEIVEMGSVAFEVIHTPGHTPEHISLLVYDRSAGDEPAVMLSGGALLVGDIARPDLLGGEDEAQKAAVTFCHTIQEKILWKLEDHVEVFPTHVKGSLCGGNIGSRLSTTVGYERKTNAILARVSSSEEFVDECIRLDNLPAVPPYWRRMRSQNMTGPELLGILAEPPALKPKEFKEVHDGGAIVVDARSPEAFQSGHVPGSINVGLSSSFATWAGSVLPHDARVLLVLQSPNDLWEAAWQLLRIGYDLPVGWLSGGMQAWEMNDLAIGERPPMGVREVAQKLEDNDILVLDVRQPAEWAAGHIEGAVFITGAELVERADEVADDKPIAVVCGSGYRSSIMASVLANRGRKQVSNIAGGMSAWRAAGFPITT
jgi:hydroxyacylglutathione hydrolase